MYMFPFFPDENHSFTLSLPTSNLIFGGVNETSMSSAGFAGLFLGSGGSFLPDLRVLIPTLKLYGVRKK